MDKIKLLIIGGTQMIGRDFIEYLIENNSPQYQLYMANRGITNNNIFPDIKRIIIDRNSQSKCENLSNQYFDIVIDFSCYNVNQLYNILKNLKYDKYYILSSLCSQDTNVLSDKNHWLYSYCLGKNAIEKYILSNNLNNFNIIRPCVLFGKNDYTGRFYEKNNEIYWKENNELVIPSKYYIHVRTFTKYLYSCIKEKYSAKIIHIDGDGLVSIKSNN